ncbi:MAG TPA: response regulator transcription factor [Ornithinibacter sp.]|nr:response regulator transcription factor [Ornithinibacter sp.]
MGWTLLIVDDHAGFRTAARALLDVEPFTVVGEAATGDEGLAEVERLTPQVVLLDVQLPDRDGFEVAELMARSACPPHVLLTSSRSLRDVRARVAASSAIAFLSKDQLSPGSLERALDR